MYVNSIVLFLTYIDIIGEKVKKRILSANDSVTLINRSSVELQSFLAHSCACSASNE